MSTRYVWGKWNVNKSLSKTKENPYSGFPLSDTASTHVVYYSSTVSISPDGLITLDSPKEFTTKDSQFGLNGKYWYYDSYRNLTECLKNGRCQIMIRAVNSYQVWGYGSYVSDGPVEWYVTTSSKGSTSYGNVSSANSGAYPANSYSGNYWYVSKGNDTIDPASVTYPASPNGGELIDITIAPSTGNTFGGTVKYKVEYQLNGGSWQTAVESTTSTTVSVLIPKGTNTFAARATASDDTGFTSTDTVTGQTVNVVNNAAPVISCGTSSLGEIAEPFSVSYSVSDEDGDTMTITEKIDGTTIRSYSAPSGSSGEQTFNPSEAQWLTTLNGSHTATITADDGKGGVTTHSISFTRAVHTMTVTLEEPMETDAAITKCVVNIARNLPADAEWSLLVTNNAFDPEPVWEDITDYIKNGWNWVFENQTVTSGRYGFNFKLTCTRGASGQGGSVDTISGGFE